MSNKLVVPFVLGTMLLGLVLAPVAFGDDTQARSSQNGAESSAIETEPYIGLGVGPLPPVLTAQLPEVTGKGRGVLVDHVMKESPAEKAGLQQYDVLIRYDKQELYSPEQLVKLVRNDEPGREVSLTYVRSGEPKQAIVRLGEMPRREPVRAARGVPFKLQPDSPETDEERKQVERRERNRQNDPQPWTTFKSLTITKLDDGQYKAEIDYRDKDEKVLHRDYVGTREEIRKAIQSDESLPKDEREHLLRSLDQQTPAAVGFNFNWPRSLRDLFEIDRDRFNWPNLNF